MSMFLGPIHYWLYNKIQLVEAREVEVALAFKEKYGDEVSALVEANCAEHGQYYDDAVALEDMIGATPIHQYLDGAIRQVETREAALLKKLIEKYGDDAKELALGAAKNHGDRVGMAENEEVASDDATPGDILNAVKNTFLDGMPCDHVTGSGEATANSVTETHSDCLHRDFWTKAGASETFMCSYLGRWIDGFAEAVGGKHRRGKTLVNGDAQCEDVYSV